MSEALEPTKSTPQRDETRVKSTPEYVRSPIINDSRTRAGVSSDSELSTGRRASWIRCCQGLVRRIFHQRRSPSNECADGPRPR